MKDKMKKEEQIIQDHTEWATKFFRFVYGEAFKHGFKHGKEIQNKTLKGG